MPKQTVILAFTFGALLCGCAGFKGGWESVPYVGERSPKLQEAQTPFESRERTRLRFEQLTLGVIINNQMRTYDTQVFALALPLVIDPRNVPIGQVQTGKTRVTLQISDIRADMTFQPRLARLSVGDSSAQALAAFEFGMWDESGQRVTSGGRWSERPISDSFSMQDRTRTYLLSIDFPVDPPSPESQAISLDLSQALSAPGMPPMPLIKFMPGRWTHGYT